MSINMAILIAHTKCNQDTWMQLGHAFFGAGGFFGPFIVFLFEENSYIVLGLACGILAPLYILLESP